MSYFAPIFSLPRTVILLSVVSLLNDVASDMIVPLLPIFLTTVLGATPVIVGLVEGVADALSSLLKWWSGRLADRGWSRKGLVFWGYSVSSISRPFLAVAVSWAWVVLLRATDRVGKGLRTAPRDALIAEAVPTHQRGRAFGLHRAFDHTGAMIGPLVAFGLLQIGWSMEQVFMAAAVPGLMVMLLLAFGLPATPKVISSQTSLVPWRELDVRLRALVVAAGGVALAGAPEAFLVLWALSQGVAVVWVPLLWVAAHAVKTAVVYVTSSLSDRVGRLRVIVLGWSARAAMLVLLAIGAESIVWTWGLFLLYAATVAATEGAERALIGDVAPPQHKASAFGLYHMATALFALPGALLFGVVWQKWGASNAFVMAAVLTLMLIVLLWVFLIRARAPRELPTA